MVDREVGGVRVRIGGDNTGLRQSVEDSKQVLGELNTAVRGIEGALKVVGAAIVATVGTMSVQKVMSYADSWSEMRARVANAKDEMESTDAIMRRLNDVASRTYSSLNQTAESWLRNSTALRELGYSTQQQLDLTEALNNALVISATRGQRAESVMNAWSNAMATGSLRGQNFNTIVAGSDRLAQALADSLGVTTLELRQLAADGKITTDVMYGVTSQLEELREEADAMPATLEDAAVAWDKAFQVIIGTVDQTTGASEGLAAMAVDMARAFEAQATTIARVFGTVQTVVGGAVSVISQVLGDLLSVVSLTEVGLIAAGGAAGLLAFAVGTTLVAGVQAATGAVAALTAALLANPIGLLVSGFGAAAAAAFLFRDDINEAIGVDIVGIFKDTANFIIGSMVGAYESIKSAWRDFPTFLGAIGKLAWNEFLKQFEGPALTITTPWGGSHSFFNVSLDGMKADLTEAENAALGQVQAVFDDAYSRDYLGGMGEAIEQVWKEAGEANEEITKLIDNMNDPALGGGGGGGGGGSSGGRSGKSQAERQAEEMARRLEALRESFFTEEMLERDHYAKRLAEIESFYEARMIQEGEYLGMIEQARLEHEERMEEISRRARQAEIDRYSQMAGYITGTLQSISQVMDSEGDRQIGIQKAISLAIAGINVAEGITKALTLPFPMNLMAAAQTAAQGMAAIASINSAGRGNPGLTSAAGAAPAAPPAAAAQQTIYLRGITPDQLFSGSQVLGLIENINQAVSDGAKLVVNPE